MASNFGVKVNAIEFLEKSVRIGQVINLLTQCGDKVQFVNSDVTKLDFTLYPSLSESHDLLVSQLALLHIEDKENLFQVLSKLLKPGGKFFIEDFFLLDGEQFTPEEISILEHDISVPKGKLNTKAEYLELLEKNGLEVETWRDDTPEWSDFVWERYEKFLANIDHLREKRGDQYVQDMGHFYKQMAVLYHGDEALRSKFPLALAAIPEEVLEAMNNQRPHLGGVTIIGTKKDI